MLVKNYNDSINCVQIYLKVNIYARQLTFSQNMKQCSHECLRVTEIATQKNSTWLLGAWKILVYLGRAWERRSPAHVFHRTGDQIVGN